MPGTLQGLTVLFVGLLPGALFTWAFEQLVGNWGVNLADRVLRFIGVSALFHVAAFPLTYLVWRDELRPILIASQLPGLPWLAWLALLVYTIVPLVLGRVVGHAIRHDRRWARSISGSRPAPRAWDYLFNQPDLEGFVQLKLKDGTWLGGAYARNSAGRISYAAGYPDPSDLYLAVAYLVDSGGAFVFVDGRPVEHGELLVRWEEIEYLVFTEAGRSGEHRSGKS